jgi:hypothetical protein
VEFSCCHSLGENIMKLLSRSQLRGFGRIADKQDSLR